MRTYSKTDPSARLCCDGDQSLTGVIEEIKKIKFRQLNVEYGIETCFVEEGKGRAIESVRNSRDLKVRIFLKKGTRDHQGLGMGGKVVR